MMEGNKLGNEVENMTSYNAKYIILNLNNIDSTTRRIINSNK